MSEKLLTNQEKLQIAVEVFEGSRPFSDMEKQGLSFGDEIGGDLAKQLFLDELRLMGINLEDDGKKGDSEV
jgi:hypothetical protein